MWTAWSGDPRPGPDFLTGLPLRWEYTPGNWSRFCRQREIHEDAPSIALVNVLGLKWVNDRIDMGAGNQLLVDVARRLVAATEGHALVARIGGNEFAIASGYEPQPLRGVLTAVDDVWSIASRSMRVELMVGVAAVDDPSDEGWMTAILRADRNLVAARAAWAVDPAHANWLSARDDDLRRGGY